MGNRIAPNRIVRVRGGYVVAYEDRSWLSVGAMGVFYWSRFEGHAAVIPSFWRAFWLAKKWDFERWKAVRASAARIIRLEDTHD